MLSNDCIKRDQLYHRYLNTYLWTVDEFGSLIFEGLLKSPMYHHRTLFFHPFAFLQTAQEFSCSELILSPLLCLMNLNKLIIVENAPSLKATAPERRVNTKTLSALILKQRGDLMCNSCTWRENSADSWWLLILLTAWWNLSWVTRNKQTRVSGWILNIISGSRRWSKS